MTTALTPVPSKLPHYVLGFMFSNDLTRVAVIQKQKPQWQKGLLNGIGGKIEPGENIYEAMIREFREETGYETLEEEWSYFLCMKGTDPKDPWRCECFAIRGNLLGLRTMETELVLTQFVPAIHIANPCVVENLPWVIGMAHDHLTDGRPAFATVEYP